MGINVNSLSPTQAREYWHDYNNGNKKGISNAEYASLCTKFKSEIKTWEKDENTYTYRQSPEDRLDFDEDDAGFMGSDGKGVESTVKTAANGAIAIWGTKVSGAISGVAGKAADAAAKAAAKKAAEDAASEAAKKAAEKGATDATKKAAEKAAEEATTKAAESATADAALKKAQTVDSVCLLVLAGLQLASALHTKANSPNEEAVEACQKAQDEMYNEQAILADQVLTMEEMQEEMAVLQEEAEATNEEGQADIATMEGMYNYYYAKYQNGTATDQDIALLKALGAQMGVTQSRTGDATEALNGEIAKVGEGYEEITANIDNTNNFTDYVSEIDEATKTNSIIQGALMTVSCASAAATALKCYSRASALAGSVFGSWAAALYTAAAVAAGGAAAIFGMEAYKQFGDNRQIADDTINIRQDTQDLSVETTEFQEVSTEFWEETVDATSEENLFTLTPTYAKVSGNGQQGQNDGDADKGKTRSAGNNGAGTNNFGAVTGDSGTTNAKGTNNNEQDDKDKNKQK